MGGDQGGTDTRVETNLFIDGFCITLGGAGVASLGLAKHRADQAIKHIDGPIGQTGGNVQTNGDQRCVSPAAFVASDMLGGGAAGFATKRKISGGTRSLNGRDCRDAFLGLNAHDCQTWLRILGLPWRQVLHPGPADRSIFARPCPLSRTARVNGYATGFCPCYN